MVAVAVAVVAAAALGQLRRLQWQKQVLDGNGWDYSVAKWTSKDGITFPKYPP